LYACVQLPKPWDPGVPGRLSIQRKGKIGRSAKWLVDFLQETMDAPSELWRYIFWEKTIAEEIMILSMKLV